ncbi:MAG: hypothetical protein K0S11_974, partial [Gammaproteobacteria bacterium]|nr:hypothetical protein [Gammaproteobacteria bacterium]
HEHFEPIFVARLAANVGLERTLFFVIVTHFTPMLIRIKFYGERIFYLQRRTSTIK